MLGIETTPVAAAIAHEGLAPQRPLGPEVQRHPGDAAQAALLRAHPEHAIAVVVDRSLPQPTTTVAVEHRLLPQAASELVAVQHDALLQQRRPRWARRPRRSR